MNWSQDHMLEILVEEEQALQFSETWSFSWSQIAAEKHSYSLKQEINLHLCDVYLS